MEVYRNAQSNYNGGDEELSFIFYMRYINIIKSLQKKPEYLKNKREITALFGGNGYLGNALDTAEALQKSLIAR